MGWYEQVHLALRTCSVPYQGDAGALLVHDEEKCIDVTLMVHWTFVCGFGANYYAHA